MAWRYERLHASEGYSNHVHPDAAWGRLDFIYVEGKTADGLFGGAVRTTLFPQVDVLVPADVAALRRASQASAAGEPDYLAFLARFPPPTAADLRARPGPRGAPFRL